jgi:hypothetical protein
VKDRSAPFLPLSDRLPFRMRCLRSLFPLLLLGLASCSASSKPSAALSSLRASSAPTTAGVTTTSTAVASTAVAVTVPQSTTSTATAKSLEVVVAEAAVQNWIVDREGCYLAIDTCDPTLFTPEGSAQREAVTKIVTEFRTANLRMRGNADDPSYIVVKGAVLGADRATAEVKACYWSTEIVYEPNVKVVGGEIVSNDKKSSRDVVLQMVLVGKRWLISDFKNTTKYEGFNTCPAK